MPNVATDIRHLSRAIFLATEYGLGHTRPNPAVGAVIVKGGKVIGEGWHRKAGSDHAEVAAIKDAAKRGNPTKGATIYVTLEPCSKPGRVGACTDAIISAGIKRVVFGSADPNPVNGNRAKRVLAKAGIACSQIASFKTVSYCDNLIRAFAKHVTTGLPYVTVKIAMSLDGRICDDYGDARWISSEKARRDMGVLRRRVDAIMVGAETIRRDDPELLSHGKRNDDLVRVVITRSGRLPKNAKVLSDGKNLTLVYRASTRKSKSFLAEVMKDLGARGLTHILCEGGLKLASSLAEEGLVDEWETVLAPKIIGSRHVTDAVRIRRAHVYLDDVVKQRLPFILD